MIQRNMQLISRVWRVVVSSTFQFSLPDRAAAIVARSAPTAELSVRLVMPVRNSVIMMAKTATGMMPSRSSTSFSRVVIWARSSSDIGGPSSGWIRQRM